MDRPRLRTSWRVPRTVAQGSRADLAAPGGGGGGGDPLSTRGRCLSPCWSRPPAPAVATADGSHAPDLPTPGRRRHGPCVLPLPILPCSVVDSRSIRAIF